MEVKLVTVNRKLAKKYQLQSRKRAKLIAWDFHYVLVFPLARHSNTPMETVSRSK